ncbi:uncharacterized protein LY79DRAFT_564245 [Colletotrichum navitas]|uniref:Uncharacterized protein n=1 Tax=Colletotrichum navitas TaxID=681940 RepID=A0AAD8UZN8_9PEZI|nr:uncharacterized protein LY79DRAFT_564245 [Colletotrichum navitas]KAK1579470.1 hypothetical protein LY79DRAFT_564245 [Colletotrichum navitas]
MCVSLSLSFSLSLARSCNQRLALRASPSRPCVLGNILFCHPAAPGASRGQSKLSRPVWILRRRKPSRWVDGMLRADGGIDSRID